MPKEIGDMQKILLKVWMMLLKPDDYVIATGKSCTVREFVEKLLRSLVLISRKGKSKEVGYNIKNNQVLIKIDKNIFDQMKSRFRGDYKKAKKS